MNNSII